MKKYINRQNKNTHLKEVKSGKYSIIPNNGRIFTKSISFLNVIRDVLEREKKLTKKFVIKVIRESLSFYNKKVNYRDTLQLGESFIFKDKKYRLSLKNNSFVVIPSSTNFYYSIIRTIKKVNDDFDQVSIDNGFCKIVPVNTFNLYDFVKLDESTKELILNNTEEGKYYNFGKNMNLINFTIVKNKNNNNSKLLLNNKAHMALKENYMKGLLFNPGCELIKELS